jgi:hypothetical protein
VLNPSITGVPRRVAKGTPALLVAAALCAATTPAAEAHHTDGCLTRACDLRVTAKQHAERERVLIRRCGQRTPRWCVERAIHTYRLGGWRAAWMRRVPGCESRWNPYAYNPSGATGLFQFLPSTWTTTRYGRRSITSAKWQALAAAWMLRQGRSREWVCS